jgi:molybdenum-dependent DNA-binding transcriptional regulator ModE
MTAPKPPRRSNADYRWTRPKLLAFMDALAATGSVARAARSVGMSRQSAYRLRARLGARFGAVWDEALVIARVRRIAQGDGSGPR